jgi:hypothetical protein
MDGDSIACGRGRCGNFRQRHHHISALRHRGGFDDCELARIAQRLVARCGNGTVLGLSDLFDSIAERVCVAAEAHRLLAITGMECLLPAAGLLRVSATVDATAFIFEYLVGVYIQVYLITVCLAWIRGFSFEEGELFGSP